MSRGFLATCSLAMLTVLGIGFLLFGVSYLNVDSLRDDPALVTFLFIVPFFLGILTLLLAALPPLLRINLLVFLALWLGTEAIFGILVWLQVQHPAGDPVGINQEYYLQDPILGYKPAPNTVARHTETYEDRRIYSVTYVIDGLGRRDTPVDCPSSRTKFLLFFGDSNTFGDGLEQKQTLPYDAGRLAPGYQPYNYGFSGWGPAQMLDILKTRDIKSEVKPREGYAIFFFIEDHIARVIGGSRVSTEWGRHLSHYVWHGEGRLVREGDFATGRPFLTLFYDLVGTSNVVKYFDLVWPIWYSDWDYRLTAEVFRESQAILEKEFKLDGFYIVVSPAFDQRARYIYLRFVAELRRGGVKYLDFTKLYDTEDVRYREDKEDYHNSALADRLIAQELVKELGIAG